MHRLGVNRLNISKCQDLPWYATDDHQWKHQLCLFTVFSFFIWYFIHLFFPHKIKLQLLHIFTPITEVLWETGWSYRDPIAMSRKLVDPSIMDKLRPKIKSKEECDNINFHKFQSLKKALRQINQLFMEYFSLTKIGGSTFKVQIYKRIKRT